MNNKEAEQILEWAKAVEARVPRIANDMRNYINQEYNPASVDEKLDRIIELLSRPRILTQDPLDALGQLNENLVKRRPEQPDPTTLSVLHHGVRLQAGDWAVECSNPGHFLKVHPDQFGKFADHPAYSYFRPKTYAEAVDAGELIRPHVVKLELPPYPPVPSGYSHWEARSPGWRSFDPVKFAFVECGWSEWTVAQSVRPTCGDDLKIHYIEAVREQAEK